MPCNRQLHAGYDVACEYRELTVEACCTHSCMLWLSDATVVSVCVCMRVYFAAQLVFLNPLSSLYASQSPEHVVHMFNPHSSLIVGLLGTIN